MSLTLKLKRLTQEELLAYVGSEGEILVNSTTNTLVLMDGVTPGGHPYRPVDRTASTDYISIQNRWLFVNNGMIVDARGNPIREMGYNTMQMLAVYAADTYNQADTAPREIPKLAAHNIRHIRAMSVPMFWRGDFDEFIQRGDTYWDRMEQILDMCYNNGIGVQFDMVKNYQCIPDYVGEPVSAWTDKNSATFQLWLNKCWIPLITRFVDHPAISSWSIVNELNMVAEYRNVPEVVKNADGTLSTWHGTAASYARTAENLITEDECELILQNIADEIRARDSVGRMISSGNNGRLTSRADDEGWYSDGYCHKINSAADTITIHHYKGHTGGYNSLYDELVLHRNIGDAVGKPFILQEIGYGSGNNDASNICRQIYQSGTQLSLWWMWKWNDTINNDNSGELHPQHVLEERVEIVRTIDRWNRKMRAAGYSPVPPRTHFATRPRPMSSLQSTGTGKVEIDISDLNVHNGFSFAFWCKPNSDIVDSGTLLACSDSTELTNTDTADGFAFNIFGNGAMQVATSPAIKSTSGSHIIGLHRSPLLETHEWMHVVIQCDAVNNDFRVYMNGKLRGKFTATGPVVFPNKPLTLFSHNNLLNNDVYWSDREHNIPFMIGDFTIMDRALTDDEVKSLFFHNRIPSRDNSSDNIALARWTFEGGSLTDVIGGKTATVVGTITSGSTITLPTKY